MDIAIVAYDNMAALDAIGPFEVLAHLPDATVTWVGLDVGIKRTEEGGKGGVGINADAAIEELPHPDVIVVPGGHGEQALLATTSASSHGCRPRTRRRRGPHRCARARCCWAPRAC